MPERSRSRTSGHNYRELLSRPTSRRDFFLRSGAGIGVVTAGIMLAKAATIDTHSTPPTLHPTPDEETEPAQQYDLLGHRFPFHMEGPFTRSDIFDLHTVDYPADAVALYKPPSLLVTDEVPIDNDMYYLNDDGVVTLRGGLLRQSPYYFDYPTEAKRGVMEALLYSIYHDISETTPAGKAKSSYEAWYRNPSVSRIETIGNEVYYKDFAVSADQTLPAISFPDQIANKTLPEGEIIPDAGRNWARYIGMMALYGHELLQEIEIIPSSFYDHEGLIGQMCRESLTILNARNSSEKAFDKLIPNHRKLAYKGVHIAHSETAETATLFHFE